MPISGLVVTCDASTGPIDNTVAMLAAHRSVEVGEVSTNRIAIVVDSESKQHDQEIWQWVQELPSVIDVNVAFVGFDEDADGQVDSDAGDPHDRELVE